MFSAFLLIKNKINLTDPFEQLFVSILHQCNALSWFLNIFITRNDILTLLEIAIKYPTSVVFISKNSKFISGNINLKYDTAKCFSVTHNPPSTLATNRCIHQSLSQSIHLSTSSHSPTHHLEFIFPFITVSAACGVSSLLHFFPPPASICHKRDKRPLSL